MTVEKDRNQTAKSQVETEPCPEAGKTTVFLEQRIIDLIAAGAKKMGMDPEEFLEKSIKDYLEKLKLIYPDTTPTEPATDTTLLDTFAS